MNLKDRLTRLEALTGPAEPEEKPATLAELVERVEEAFELPAGSLPRTPEEATARGHDSMSAAVADALGITNRELFEMLKGGEDEQP